MKRFVSRRLAALPMALAGLLMGSGIVPAQEPRPVQEPKVVPSRPGQRSPVPVPGPTEGSIRLSLDQAIGIAVANNEDLNITVNSAEANRYVVLQDQGIFDPLVQAAVSRSHTEQPATSTLVGAAVQTRDSTDGSVQVSQLAPTGGVFSLGLTGNRTATNSSFFNVNPSYSGGVTLSMNQPLLRNAGYKTTTWLIRIAKDTRDASYQDYVRSVQTAVNTVEQAYWDLVYSLQNLDVKRESLRIAQELNRITRIKIDVGSLAPIEITQTEVGIANAEQDIINAESLIGDAQDRLKRVLNFDPAQWNVPIYPTDQVRSENVKIDLDRGVQSAIATRPEVVSERYVVDIQRIRYDYWSNQALPGLNLVGSYGGVGLGGTFLDVSGPGPPRVVDTRSFWSALSDAVDRKAKNWSIGLNFSYPILNRAGRGARGAAKYQFEAERSRLTTIEQNVLVEVRAAARSIDTAWRSILAAQKGRELAERNLDAEKKKFDNGMSTTFQVNQIQRDLSAARTLELQALAVYRKALAQYHFAIADNLDWKGVRIEGLPEATPPAMESRAGAYR